MKLAQHIKQHEIIGLEDEIIEIVKRYAVFTGGSGGSEPVITDHNSLSGLQGGAVAEYYHLQQSAYDYLKDQDQSVYTTSDVRFATAVVGTNANLTDFTAAKIVASTANTGYGTDENVAVVGEAQNDAMVAGIGVLGVADKNSETQAIGVKGIAKVSNIDASSWGIGVYGEATDTADLGTNVAFYANALNAGDANYSFYGQNGQFYNAGAITTADSIYAASGNISGTLTVGQLIDNGLTADKVVYTSATKQLTTTTNFAFNGTNFAVGNTPNSNYRTYSYFSTNLNASVYSVFAQMYLTGTNANYPAAINGQANANGGANTLRWNAGGSFFAYVNSGHSGTITDNIGGVFEGRDNSTSACTVSNNYGGMFSAYLGGATVTGTIGNNYCGLFQYYHDRASAGTVTNNYGIRIAGFIPAGNIGTNYGIHIGNPSTTTGTITTAHYGLWIDALRQVSGVARAIASGAGNRHGFGTSTPQAVVSVAGSLTNAAWGTAGMALLVSSATYTDSSTAGSGTATNAVASSFLRPTFAASNSSVTMTNSATLYIENAPLAGTNVTLTNAWALWVDNGACRFDGDIDFATADASNLIFGTTTGTKIGTATSQKLAFYNSTPIVQPTTAIAAATLVGGGGTNVTDTDTFDGYTLKQVVKALRNLGLLA